MKRIILCVLIIAVFLFIVVRITGMEQSEETEMVRTAVKNAAMTCYVVEGAYPPDIQYLRDHYGLRYNSEFYIVSYDAFASNVMPEITVMERGVAK